MTDNHSPDPRRDNIYAQAQESVPDFAFDDRVAQVFPDMIKRSVPGYSTIVHMIGQMAERYCQSGTRCYDLGCSLGAATLAMRHRIHAANAKIVAVDNSANMIERCRQVIEADSGEVAVELALGDILNTDIQNASVCVLNFTLQFVPLDKRHQLLERIYEGMVDGGIIIISEKLAFCSAHHQTLMSEFHHYFKKTNGYSELEIAQKREAIDQVLIPETLEAHKKRLHTVGFRDTELWFQCFNFASFIAFK